jgi:hypothetical protein
VRTLRFRLTFDERLQKGRWFGEETVASKSKPVKPARKLRAGKKLEKKQPLTVQMLKRVP